MSGGRFINKFGQFYIKDGRYDGKIARADFNIFLKKYISVEMPISDALSGHHKTK